MSLWFDIMDIEMEESMKKSKYDRILTIYSMLNSGEIIKKSDLANKFEVNERTIQRDIEDIRAFFSNNTYQIGFGKSIIFDRKNNGYRLIGSENDMLSDSEILAVCKILLESRSLVKSEMMPIIEKIIRNNVSRINQKSVSSLLSNEVFHYIAPRHKQKLMDKLWSLGMSVHENRYVEITYNRISDNKTVTRRLKPVGIMVSEFYFYLTAFIDNIDKTEHFENPDDLFPTIYRIDRIKNINVSEEKFNIPYSTRFEEGEFRKRIQFMYGGKLQKVKFTFSGKDIDAVLDRIPTAKIISVDENGVYTLTAEVFGKGIDMWFRSQGELIKICR